MRTNLMIVMLAAMSGGCTVMEPPGTADLVILNARVWTGTDREASAVAIRGERIAAVGPDAEVRRWIGDGSRVIDAGGKRVVPGITDCHLHLLSGGLALAEGTAGAGRGFVLMPSAAPYGRTISSTTMRNYETMVRLAEAW